MRKWMGLWLLVILLAGCVDNATQKTIQQFTSSMENELHFVYFYDDQPPKEQLKSQLTGMKVYLARKNIIATISYQKIHEDKNYEEILGVKDQQILVFDYKGIRFNARNIHVLEGMILQIANQ
ncbi:hypothetical protein [Halobacillus litoralis]|uniref:hypothetical protein n=1 Tax=Halobacillus litoralis TaxID=45668 RepID=UPI001CFD9A57|nr:hypothetical protein [Halobacillus litoralis]